MQRPILVPVVAAALISLTLSGFAEVPHGIPLKPDPPIAVDGDLGDWSGVLNAIEINQPAQVVEGLEA